MVATPGTGWPGDPATPTTPVATDLAAVRGLAAGAESVAELDARISVCRACPRLVDWREDAARTKKRAFADQDYWGRPVPGFGAEHPQVMIIGLAPSAHGANRTGRNFTGDRSGDWLFAALHRVGLANQSTSVAADDGLRLDSTRIAGAVRCAPPANKPTAVEQDTCRPWLTRQLELAWPSLRAIVTLGAIGWQALWPALAELGIAVPTPNPRFGHGVRFQLPDDRLVLGCFHVSPQNTNTGRLTEAMLDQVLTSAREWSERRS